MKQAPDDLLTDYLEKNEYFVLVKDPKHNDSMFHFTIWSLDENMKDINNLHVKTISYLDSFIKKIKEKKYFNNEKMYFTYPPTHSRLHLHIVPKNYNSHRSLCELFFYENICKILN